MEQGPLTPMGGWTGVLVGEIPGQRPVCTFDQVAIWTPQMHGLSTPLDELIITISSPPKNSKILNVFTFLTPKTFFR